MTSGFICKALVIASSPLRAVAITFMSGSLSIIVVIARRMKAESSVTSTFICDTRLLPSIVDGFGGDNRLVEVSDPHDRFGVSEEQVSLWPQGLGERFDDPLLRRLVEVDQDVPA